MNEMKIAVTGASGRMGQALIRAIVETPGLVLAGAIEREGSPHVGQDAGLVAGSGSLDVVITDDANAVFQNVDGVVDFTIPAATISYAKLAAETKTVHIIGTTGCSKQDDDNILSAAKNTAIVKAGNMSLGVNLLSVLVEQAAKALSSDSFDIEVLEMHHRHKVDAPSGTALLLGEAAAKGRQIDLNENSVRVRDGHTGARKSGDIGFATLRGGSVVGEHSVFFAGQGETITLSHSAGDRTNFAAGAVKAALWARDKSPGLYTMKDVLGL